MPSGHRESTTFGNDRYQGNLTPEEWNAQYTRMESHLLIKCKQDGELGPLKPAQWEDCVATKTTHFTSIVEVTEANLQESLKHLPSTADLSAQLKAAAEARTARFFSCGPVCLPVSLTVIRSYTPTLLSSLAPLPHSYTVIFSCRSRSLPLTGSASHQSHVFLWRSCGMIFQHFHQLKVR